MKKPPNSGLTPNKQKRRPDGGDPSPVKPFKISGGNAGQPNKQTMRRPQGR